MYTYLPHIPSSEHIVRTVKKEYNNVMNSRFIIPVIALTAVIFLSGCGEDKAEEIAEENPVDQLVVSGAKSAAITANIIAKGGFNYVMVQRPTAPTGLFTSMFIAQGEFLPSNSALAGVNAQASFIRGQEGVATDETFSLLQEFGNLLQIDVTDMLNRGNDREKSLNQYLKALKNAGVRMERRQEELKETQELTKDERIAQRKVVRELNREVQNAIRDEDYVLAGSLQQNLSKEEGILAEIESKERLASDILDSYKDLLAIGEKRFDAMIKNREVLIAGVRVVDVPGVDDLDILFKQPYERKKNRNTFSD